MYCPDTAWGSAEANEENGFVVMCHSDSSYVDPIVIIMYILPTFLGISLSRLGKEYTVDPWKTWAELCGATYTINAFFSYDFVHKHSFFKLTLL